MNEMLIFISGPSGVGKEHENYLEEKNLEIYMKYKDTRYNTMKNKSNKRSKLKWK